MSTALEIQRYLKPADIEQSQTRALEVLNRYHTVSQDISSLAEASSQAQSQRDALAHALSESQANLTSLISQVRASLASHLHTAQELSLLRHSLTDELSSLTSELVSTLQSDGGSTLLEDIETMHRNLKEQESIKVYVQIIHRALQLSEDAVREVQSTRPISVSVYQSLQTFVSSVSGACSKVSEVTGQSDANLRILSFLEEYFPPPQLLATSEKLRWPLPVATDKVENEDMQAFARAFRDLLTFQEIGEPLHAQEVKNPEKSGLYAIQALIQPIHQRFKYHFEGTRQTNRLDKPEWYFTHILNVSHEHRSFMERVVQSLLSPTKYHDIDAWREFTYNLFPLLSRHLKRSIPAVLPHPPLLAHTIYQSLAFDVSLRDDGFTLSGTIAGRSSESKEWEGISAVVLGRRDWFDTWMEGEKTFALDQYHEIISAQDAWTIVDDESDLDDSRPTDRDTRPTVSARQLKALVEQVTDRYSPLPEFGQRTRFLITVQLPLLESYHGRISSSLDAFESLSSVFVRAVPGALGSATGEGRDRGHLTSGVEGVERLCKALVSAKFMASAMEGWGEDLFFLELWAEINHKASLRARAETHPSLPDPKAVTTDAPDGTIFEELVLQYNKLVSRAEDMIVQQVSGEVEGALKPYFSNQATPRLTQSDLAISPALLPALSILSSHLAFLRRTLPRRNVTSIYRRVATQLSAHILQRAILYRRPHEVSATDGQLLHGECELWVQTCRQALGTGAGGRIEAPWRRLLEAGHIVGADGDRWDRILDTSFGTLGEAQWAEEMESLVGGSELSREEVCMAARTRADCDR
ncbi:hypothetical protein BV25DRAFT_1867678 [Artomyces pyxidatus]|uniref:Uncharacterized protein n=1 Tax=Artomyces pyxidatus TaxID=48021 RepID=A0ACB8THN2_9AGAM|nr:hypothetical protein BV25DRAFT_1867678 [Artomyces pyxidatus]